MMALATVAALLTVLTGLLLVAGVMGARGRAQAAADLGALAAAQAVLRGESDPCARAATVAAANRADLVDCSLVGEYATVAVRAAVVWVGRTTGLHAGASARAGPET